ncbi:DUF3667 domain-containing protein [Xanthomarina sp. F2636L]|uniref:DUF3667 domain-containing protein n=1 Tax=Xanthomarina sp. F2636L TaxID=2996018 RepID=UPI00225E3DF0|nr:DUF3667 domain-containing protein [Xanthomarina sp. F2636L]MCX7549757.1 DUF3667 domain-containing protein [Xanthomarina sp. F2636L]
MSTNQTICKNCENSFDSDFKFCPHCGQKDKDELTLGVLFYNTISNYFSFDARFFKSFIPLLIKPGYLARKFIEGKRLLYLHPAQMYLFVAIVFFFLFSFKANEQASDMDKGLASAFEEHVDINSLSEEEVLALKLKDSLDREEARIALKKTAVFSGMTEKQIDSLVSDKNFNSKKNDISFAGTKVDSLIKINAPDKEILTSMGLEETDSAFKKRLYAQALKFLKSKQGGSILQTFYDTVPIAMFFVLPLFALLLKLFYRKSGRYAHHLVFSFYFFAFIFTVFSLIVGINLIVDIPDWIDTIIVLSIFIYLFIALKRFYKQSWLKSYFKCSLITLLFFPIVSLVAVGVAFFAFMFY